jgi:hypothetical protein
VSHLCVLLARLSSLVRRSPPENAPNELQQPSTPSPLSPRALFARLSSLLYRPRLNADEETEHQPTTPSGLHPAALIDRLSSLFRFQVHTNEEIELSQYPRHPRVVEVNAVRDREVCLSSVYLLSSWFNYFFQGYIHCSATATKSTANPITRPRVVHDTACSRH